MFGVTQKGARKWLEGEGFPTIAKAVQIAKRVNVAFEWLMTGRGAKRLPRASAAYEVREEPENGHGSVIQFPGQGVGPLPGYIRLARLGVQPSAEPGGQPIDYPEVVQEVDVLESWARQSLGVSDPKRVRIVSCRGDSMAPTIQNGDLIFVDVSSLRFDGEAFTSSHGRAGFW